MPLRLVSREEWGAKKPVTVELLDQPVPAVILKYYTRTEGCFGDQECFRVLRDLQYHHMKVLFYVDIKYNFLIGEDGTVYEGRGWFHNSTKQDIRYVDYYWSSIDIALLGDYQKVDPPAAMAQAVKYLVAYGVMAGFLTKDHELLENRRDTVMPYDPGWEEAYGDEHEFESHMC